MYMRPDIGAAAARPVGPAATALVNNSDEFINRHVTEAARHSKQLKCN